MEKGEDIKSKIILIKNKCEKDKKKQKALKVTLEKCSFKPKANISTF
ncbi:hypothetical protein JTS93_01755 [Clostridium botulinum]|nr:hypothetical protein [Clostridium botulinum]